MNGSRSVIGCALSCKNGGSECEDVPGVAVTGKKDPATPLLPLPRPRWLCPLEASVRQGHCGLQSEGHPSWSGGWREAGRYGNVGLGGPWLLPGVMVQAPSGQTGAMASSSGAVSRRMAELGERVIHSPQPPGDPTLPLPALSTQSSGVSPTTASPVSPTALTPSPLCRGRWKQTSGTRSCI